MNFEMIGWNRALLRWGRMEWLAGAQVTLSKDFTRKIEVTQAQYEAVMTGNTDGLSATPSQYGGNPIVQWRRYPGMTFRYSSPV